MAAISKIRIDGFKAFPKEFELVLNGKNLLMYGENGSGKSSIYYALHALLQSQYHDKGAIYFDKNSPESIVNKDTTTAEPYIEIELEENETKYRLSKKGYEEFPHQPISPLKDMNAECVFINHKFLFHAFSFRNSQYIDLFPVFIKDILPFTRTKDETKYISELYDEIKKGIPKKGIKIDPNYKEEIRYFNKELSRVIAVINQKDINASTLVSNIYNKYFRDLEDRELSIELNYEDNIDNIPQPNKSYWLRYGYRYQNITIAHKQEEEKVSCRLEILSPVIRLIIKEKKKDGTWQDIEKPQTYFNEAKLTAIILSIRFSLLDLIAVPDGRFLALDDVLISLDMSNRMKVIKYILDIAAPKYKLYVFTHDRLFYHTLKRIIETQYKKSDWIFGGLYINDYVVPNEPEYVSYVETRIDQIEEAYRRHDYFRCGTLLRQECERCLKDLLPESYRIKEDPKTKLSVSKNLDEQIVSLEEFCLYEQIDYTPFKDLKAHKDLFLNSTAHNDITSPFYRNEIKICMKAIKSLAQINRAKCINCHNDLSLTMTDKDEHKYTIRLRLREPLRLLEHNGTQRISFYSKCEILKIISPMGEKQINEGFESLYTAYGKICEKYGVIKNPNLLEVIQDRGIFLKDKLIMI